MSFSKGPVILTAAFCLLSGVFGQHDWGVMYPSTSICGLKGSFVDIPCTYSYPSVRQIRKTFWHINWFPDTPTDLSLDSRYQGRVEYLGDKVNDCTLRIKNLTDSDTEEKYRFRFITNDPVGKYSGSEVSLSLTDLHITVSPESVKEGEKVTLTCSSTCSLSNNPTYIWYRNSQPHKHTADNRLAKDSVSAEDAGRYSCAVQGHAIHSSPEMSLSVRYAPKNTSVSVSPSGEIKEGSTVTLTCSSDANPPVHTYTWYKMLEGLSSQVGSNQNYSLVNISSEQSGLYYCVAVNVIGKHNSSAVQINVTYPGLPRGVLFSALGGISAVALLLVVVMCWRRQKTQSTTTSRSTHSSTQGHSDPVCNVSTIHMVSGCGQRVPADHKDDDEDDVQYASVQFKPNKQREMPSQEEKVEYASVQFKSNQQQKVPSQDEDVQYASVQFRKSKPESNIPQPLLSGTSQEETQYASVSLQGLSAAPQ
ncbi:B-cell receptor CD22-like [Alosa sapidissima]|uniref:B-cell receptor CD22-like n=1 Tax=Alosa sapidissima TaxID=34773 RepID=UPI001C087855|nr:B-cell receptor CD22-like [Alosa sapidissima]